MPSTQCTYHTTYLVRWFSTFIPIYIPYHQHIIPYPMPSWGDVYTPDQVPASAIILPCCCSRVAMNTEYICRALLFAWPKKGSQSRLRRLGPTLSAPHWPLCLHIIISHEYYYYCCIHLEKWQKKASLNVWEDTVGHRRQAIAPDSMHPPHAIEPELFTCLYTPDTERVARRLSLCRDRASIVYRRTRRSSTVPVQHTSIVYRRSFTVEQTCRMSKTVFFQVGEDTVGPRRQALAP